MTRFGLRILFCGAAASRATKPDPSPAPGAFGFRRSPLRRTASALVLASVLCAGPSPATAATPQEELQAVLDKVVADHPGFVWGTSLAVDAPRAGIYWQGASGRLGPNTLEAMRPDTPFRIASTMKPFTAAAVLTLAEQGRLSLDDTIGRYIPANLVDRISVIDGVNYGPAITLRQLLRHRAGIYSHDEGIDYTAAVGAQPTKRWTPEEQVQWAIDHGAPKCRPDACFHYSDTGFVMLGMVVMKVTGKDFAAALRELLPLQRLDLAHTWHELLEPVPPGTPARAHSLYGPVDIDPWNPSFDSWGGGGYDAPALDLARYVRGLWEGRVLKPTTLREMLQMSPGDGVHKDGYGMGIGREVIDGVECFGHPGAWSSTMFYCPSLDLAFAGATNQAEDGSGPIDGDGHSQFELQNGAVRIVKAALAARGPGGAPPSTGKRRRLRLTVRPKRVRTHRRATFRVRVTVGPAPVAGALIRLARRQARTDADGRARIAARFAHPGARRVSASKPGHSPTSVKVRVVSR